MVMNYYILVSQCELEYCRAVDLQHKYILKKKYLLVQPSLSNTYSIRY